MLLHVLNPTCRLRKIHWQNACPFAPLGEVFLFLASVYKLVPSKWVFISVGRTHKYILKEFMSVGSKTKQNKKQQQNKQKPVCTNTLYNSGSSKVKLSPLGLSFITSLKQNYGLRGSRKGIRNEKWHKTISSTSQTQNADTLKAKLSTLVVHLFLNVSLICTIRKNGKNHLLGLRVMVKKYCFVSVVFWQLCWTFRLPPSPAFMLPHVFVNVNPAVKNKINTTEFPSVRRLEHSFSSWSSQLGQVRSARPAGRLAECESRLCHYSPCSLSRLLTLTLPWFPHLI